MLESFSLKGQSKEGVIITKDIVYGSVQEVDLKLDMASPAEGNAPFPALVFFHGGGWQQGDKSHMHRWLKKFALSGYVTVSVGYRFAPAFKWPSQVEDAKAAVRFLRARAKQFNIDPNRIGAMGESAGGYLALMLGFTGPTDGLEGNGGYQSFSSSVQAVVSFYSATDFSGRTWQLSPALEAEIQRYYNKSLPEVIADFTGTTDTQDPILKKISVLPYVDRNDPPVLTFHGDNDPYSPVERAQKFEQLLTQTNVPHKFVIVKGGGHGWTGALEEQTTRQMTEFFDRILKENGEK
jgi:acetyl esterase/lipase